MSGFSLHLQGARQYECIPSVESFIGEDASGRFGLLTGHEGHVGLGGNRSHQDRAQKCNRERPHGTYGTN